MILDTFPAFIDYWGLFRDRSVDEQIEGWKSVYLKPWPELFEKQVKDYQDQDLDWRKVAREKIFPFLGEREASLRLAHHSILKICEPVLANTRKQFAFGGAVTFVIHVGIGCGVGWVTEYQHADAILFGLENIAEEGWIEPGTIRGLVAHEIGHLLHYSWLREIKEQVGASPWWQLFTEGVAQRCEHILLMGEDSWHMVKGNQSNDWLAWCRENESWLAEEFLRRANRGEDIRPFFGSWFTLHGWKQCGYFLGHEIVVEMEKLKTFHEVACMKDVEGECRQVLMEMAHHQRNK